MSQVSKPLLLALVAVVGAAGFLMMSGDKSAGTASTKKKAKKSVVASASDFNDDDYNAKFDRLSGTVKNAFKPLVISYKGAGTPGALQMNAIPSLYAGGDANWTFTGVAVVDGTKMALVENAASLEAEYLKVGQAWKTCKVVSIGDTKLVLVGPSGDTRDVNLNSFEELPEGQTIPNASSNGTGTRPMNPLRGPIGNNITLAPTLDGNAAASNGTNKTNAN